MQPVANAGNRQSVPKAGNRATGGKRGKQKTIDAKHGKSCNRWQTREIVQSVPNAGKRQSMPSAENHATSIKRGKTDETRVFLSLIGWKKTYFFFSCDWLGHFVRQTNSRVRQRQNDNKRICFWQAKQNQFFWSLVSFCTNLPMTVPLFPRKR